MEKFSRNKIVTKEPIKELITEMEKMRKEMRIKEKIPVLKIKKYSRYLKFSDETITLSLTAKQWIEFLNEQIQILKIIQIKDHENK